jgi:hypothetical protein
VTVVPLTDGDGTTAAQARLRGIEQADGDVIYFTEAGSLAATQNAPDPTSDWAAQLTAAGVVRPEMPAELSQ